ncbi:MAG: KamA family radical SAM protein [Magnetococcus sp. DMHC-6]
MTINKQYTQLQFKDHPFKSTFYQENPWELRPFPPNSEELAAAQLFSFRLPRSWSHWLNGTDGGDPLLRQVVPDGQELLETAGFSTDPLQESLYQPLPGVIHKYQGRILIRVSHTCAIHCRYCFRRHANPNDIPGNANSWERVFEYIAAQTSLREVIFSGGDPLMLSDQKLAFLAQRFDQIPHLRRLRLHSRMPVVAPERISVEFINLFTSLRLAPVVLVLQVNHANELNALALQAIQRLVESGFLLFNQSVLLRGINDRVEILETLCEALIKARVTPYYLHLLDPVAGAAHFEVTEKTAIALMEQLKARLPGYALPRLVRDLPGRTAKQHIGLGE